MTVEVSDSGLVEDLVGFLRRADCVAERTGMRTVAVSFAAAVPEEAARLELELYLKAWEAAHAGVRARRRARYEL